MNLFLTQNFLFCLLLIFHTSCTLRLVPSSKSKMKEEQKKLEEEEEERYREAIQREELKTQDEEWNKQEKKAKAEEEKKEQLDAEKEAYKALLEKEEDKKDKLLELKDKVMQQKWCLSVTIQELCPNKNVTFWLYNKHSQDGYHLDENNLKTIEEAPFLEKKPIKILVHGYKGNKSSTPNKEIRPPYINKGYNIISIDYHKVVPNPCSIQAYKNIVRVAKCFAKFLFKLTTVQMKNINLSLRDYHIVGFDIGAQMAGKAGLILSDQDFLLKRITSLDAWLPVFFRFSNYISRNSAEFVDAIHTNVMTYGKMEAYGHCDFYVNKALIKSPCNLLDAQCSHRMAATYFAESIDTKTPFCGFELFFKKNTAIMGEYCPPTTRGVYIVRTNLEPPYARGCLESDKGNNDEEPSTLIKVNKTHTVRV